ncbi:uncharacterized protein LOC116340238 [Contarinia nasturtii]|uniref:uncharacterized protein LOC116340238 n=1 Tax=Contarinia nasturtii TaxID=265458 RepID=UPI0012D485CA|nr:uncharacterized protein LOC116340238 [Contarinia nasturtii]
MVRLTQLWQVLVLTLILLIATTSAGRVFRLHRSADEAVSSTTPKEEAICQENTPCGWAVYTPFTRKVDYFMKNTCVCPTENNVVCLKTDDDLSVSAFVYRCRPNPGGESALA